MKFLFLLVLLFLQVPGFAQDPEEIEADLVQQERTKKAQIQILAENTALAATEFDLMKKIKDSSIFDAKVQNVLEERFKAAKLWEVPREEVKKMIEEGSKGKSAGKIFKAFPKLLDLATNMMRSEDAFPALIKILGRKEDLKKYSLIWLSLMIVTWLVKRYLFRGEANFWRRTFSKLIISGFMSALSLVIFYEMFKNEVSPALAIATQTFWASGS